MTGDEILPLVRRWAVGWLNGHDATVGNEILVDDYRLRIGTFELGNRDAYIEATVGQLSQFPGLVLTVHEVLTNGTQAALRFSEHGVSLRHEGRAAAWTGVVLFEGNGTQLVQAWAEEDYAARKRQLAAGTPDPVGSPAVAPWDTAVEAPDPDAEDVVRAWLGSGLPSLDGVTWDDAEHDGAGHVLRAETGEADVVMSAGAKVAFHGRITGAAADGSGGSATMDVAGIVTVHDGVIGEGVVVSDRLSARSALKRNR